MESSGGDRKRSGGETAELATGREVRPGAGTICRGQVKGAGGA